MLQLFKKQPVLDEDSILWMFDTLHWALNNFDADVFFKESVLVSPSNEHFPGRVDTVDGMAGLIFEQVKKFAGVGHWPTRLINENAVDSLETPRLLIDGPVRGSKAVTPSDVAEANKLTITYNAVAINDPEVMIANYAHVIAHYLGSLSAEKPPGGEENWPHITELLAVFLGFGLMMANTAHTNKVRSCGSCGGPIVERTNYLSEKHITYALAIFCAVKDVPNSYVNRYLKKSLQPYYKKAIKDVKARTEEVDRLVRLGSIDAV